MKKNYIKPEAEVISFQTEEELMETSESFGYGFEDLLIPTNQ